MTRPLFAGRRGIAAGAPIAFTATCAAVLSSGLLITACAPAAPGARTAWNRYLEAEAAYDDCRAHHRHAPFACQAEKAVYIAERERYHAAEGAQR